MQSFGNVSIPLVRHFASRLALPVRPCGPVCPFPSRNTILPLSAAQLLAGSSSSTLPADGEFPCTVAVKMRPADVEFRYHLIFPGHVRPNSFATELKMEARAGSPKQGSQARHSAGPYLSCLLSTVTGTVTWRALVFILIRYSAAAPKRRGIKTSTAAPPLTSWRWSVRLLVGEIDSDLGLVLDGPPVERLGQRRLLVVEGRRFGEPSCKELLQCSVAGSYC